jgi:AcrR family transcriptional regulator
VLYHFSSKDAVVRAAFTSVLESLTGQVGAAVDASSGAAAFYAYIRSMVAYLRDHPAHTRMIIENVVAGTDVGDMGGAPSRRDSVASLIAAATAAGDYRSDVDPRVTAVIVNGALDAIVAESLNDPAFDTVRAAEDLVTMLGRALS